MAKKRGKKKNGRQPRPLKIAALIVSAIQDLKETKGSTPKKIIGYISYASQQPETKVKRQVKAALKRGVQYGILRRYRGHYYLPSGDELERANKIAMRFARLPSPNPDSVPEIPLAELSKAAATKPKSKKLVSSSYSTRFRKPKRNKQNKRTKKSYSLPLSGTASLADKLKYEGDDSSVGVELD